MKRIVWTFGLIAGAVLSAMMLLTLPFQDRIGFETGAVIGYTTMVAAFLMVYFGVRSYRDNVAGGVVKFGRAFRVGLLITLVGTACYVATWEVIYYKLAPDFIDKYAAYSIRRVKESGASAEQVAAKEKEVAAFSESYKNPLVNIAYTALEPLPVGLLFTLVTAGLTSRKQKSAAQSSAAERAMTDFSDDAKAIQGTWSAGTAILGGQPMPDGVVKSISLTLTDGKYQVLVGNAPDDGTYALDANARPKSMTVTGIVGPNAGKTYPAIYELKGDTLRICYDLSGAKRPAEFASTPGTMLFLVTYTRKQH